MIGGRKLSVFQRRQRPWFLASCSDPSRRRAPNIGSKAIRLIAIVRWLTRNSRMQVFVRQNFQVLTRKELNSIVRRVSRRSSFPLPVVMPRPFCRES